jgi:hypothetical protein
MNEQRKNFLESLRAIKDSYEWYLLTPPWGLTPGHFPALRARRSWGEGGLEVRGQFCPITAVVHAQTGRYVWASSYSMYVDQIGLDMHEALFIAVAADGWVNDRSDEYMKQMWEAVGVDPERATAYRHEASLVEGA